jgi:hypothetical protein
MGSNYVYVSDFQFVASCQEHKMCDKDMISIIHLVV